MVEVHLREVARTFRGLRDVRCVLKGINARFNAGEVVAIRGDNGTGKTTLLNLIAGIDSPSEGEIVFAGDVNHLRIGFVQQDYTSSLLPWFDVLENVAIPLRLRGQGRRSRRECAKELLMSLGFGALPTNGFPHQLSGGQRQRVAIARALVHTPHLLLLDEPFANLDAHTSRDLQGVLLRIHESLKPTIVYVSHELDHCIHLADRVLLLHGSPARIVQSFSVALERPRTRDMILTPGYTEIRSRILKAEEELYAAEA